MVEKQINNFRGRFAARDVEFGGLLTLAFPCRCETAVDETTVITLAMDNVSIVPSVVHSILHRGNVSVQGGTTERTRKWAFEDKSVSSGAGGATGVDCHRDGWGRANSRSFEVLQTRSSSRRALVIGGPAGAPSANVLDPVILSVRAVRGTEWVRSEIERPPTPRTDHAGFASGR